MGDNTVNPAILAAISEAVESAVARAIEPWRQELTKLRSEMEKLREEKEALSFEISNLKDQYQLTKKDLTTKAATSALKATDAEVHGRKWNLVVQGIPGEKGENEATTEQKVREMAATDLKIKTAINPQQMPFSACHRLQQKGNAGIIVRFSNLADKNLWLLHAKNLKNSNKTISISPDIPHVLKPLKTELLNARKNLSPQQKSASKMIYTKTWPYITLKYNEQTHKTAYNIDALTNAFYQSPAY